MLQAQHPTETGGLSRQSITTSSSTGTTAERFSVRWKGFTGNVASALEELHQNGHFADITLVSGDGTRVECHRLVLSAGSSYFRRILVDVPYYQLFNDIIIIIFLNLKYISCALIWILSSLKYLGFFRIWIQLCPDPDLVVSVSNAINFFLSTYNYFYLFRCIYLYLLPLLSLVLSFPPCRPANCTGNSNGEI